MEAFTRRADRARLKNFLSSSVDRYRAPYARGVEAHPRRSIFVGSSNTPELLFDPDSDRRWWISRVGGPINVGWIEEHRDQLWGEAVHRYASGQRYHLTDEEERQRKKANESYRPDNPLMDVVRAKVEEMERAENHPGYIPSAVLYTSVGLDPSRASANDRRSVSDCMRALGYEQSRAGREQGRVRVWSKR